jgi:hypothetical protein
VTAADARPLAVFDVDGVLADVRHRLRHVERRPKDWDAFFGAALDDPPLPAGVELARESAKDCEVVYVTGRPERCRADTLAWFAQHGLPEGTLRMRRERDRRPARVPSPSCCASSPATGWWPWWSTTTRRSATPTSGLAGGCSGRRG